MPKQMVTRKLEIFKVWSSWDTSAMSHVSMKTVYGTNGNAQQTEIEKKKAESWNKCVDGVVEVA